MNNEQIKKIANSQFEYVHGYGYMLSLDDLQAFANALLASEQDGFWGRSCARLQTKNAQLQLDNAKLREVLVESNALNINWSSDAEPHTLEYFSEYRKVIKQAKEVLEETK